MIVYNVTINVSDEIHDQWISWMKKDHIPKVLSTNLFVSATFNRIISNKDTGTTYAIAYKIESLSLLQKYETEFAPKLREEYTSKFLDAAPAFRTIMRVEDEF
tara:strand:- start:2197 stop:2505 length:309 start_codon:yes stop_codon:yes gene_type:complete